MEFLSVTIVVLALSFLLLMPKTLAHSPLGSGDNESLATATFVPDPTKSWAIYAELHEGGEAQYYRFNITQGERIHVMLFKSTNLADRDFVPGFVLMGAGIDATGVVPDYVEVPTGAITQVVEGVQATSATYEPFSPGTFYPLAERDLEAPGSGTYYVAVYESSTGGHYGLAIGDRESYTLSEWILIPLNLISVYQWEGQSLAFILSPLIATLVIGLVLIIWRDRKRATPRRLSSWLGSFAGLLFIGTGAIVFMQMVLSLIQTSLVSEAAITVVFALIPILLGLVTLRLCLKMDDRVSLRKRTYLVILGIVALFTWAGLLVGPMLAIITSVLPSRLIVGKTLAMTLGWC